MSFTELQVNGVPTEEPVLRAALKAAVQRGKNALTQARDAFLILTSVYPDPIPDIAMEYFHGYVGEFAVESTSKYFGI